MLPDFTLMYTSTYVLTKYDCTRKYCYSYRKNEQAFDDIITCV